MAKGKKFPNSYLTSSSQSYISFRFLFGYFVVYWTYYASKIIAHYLLLVYVKVLVGRRLTNTARASNAHALRVFETSLPSCSIRWLLRLILKLKDVMACLLLDRLVQLCHWWICYRSVLLRINFLLPSLLYELGIL